MYFFVSVRLYITSYLLNECIDSEVNDENFNLDLLVSVDKYYSAIKPFWNLTNQGQARKNIKTVAVIRDQYFLKTVRCYEEQESLLRIILKLIVLFFYLIMSINIWFSAFKAIEIYKYKKNLEITFIVHNALHS